VHSFRTNGIRATTSAGTANDRCCEDEYAYSSLAGWMLAGFRSAVRGCADRCLAHAIANNSRSGWNSPRDILTQTRPTTGIVRATIFPSSVCARHGSAAPDNARREDVPWNPRCHGAGHGKRKYADRCAYARHLAVTLGINQRTANIDSKRSMIMGMSVDRCH